MDARDPADAVEVLDLPEISLATANAGSEAARATPGHAPRGALDFVISHRAMKGDAAESIWRTKFPPQRLAMTIARKSARFRASLRRALSGDGIGSARLSFAGTVFLILRQV